MKKINEMARIFYILFLLLNFSLHAFAATYTVTQSGAGADYSASGFNALTGSKAGDVFNFSGSFSTRIIVKIYGTSGNPVTLDGWSGGSCDWVTSGVSSDCSSAANLNEGMDVGNDSTGVDGITIKDFDITCSSSNPCVDIKSANEDDYPPSTISAANRIDYLTFEDNRVHQTFKTLFHLSQGIYNTVQDNQFYKFGNGGDTTQGVNLVSQEDFIFQRNIVGQTDGYCGSCSSANMIEVHSNIDTLFQLNDIFGAPNQSGIHLKEGDGEQHDRVVIRWNRAHDCNGSTGKAIMAGFDRGGTTNNIYIYGNFIYDNKYWGIGVYSHTVGIRIWSNIIVSAGRKGITVFKNTYTPDDTYIINNTLAYNGDLDESDWNRGGIVVQDGTNTDIRNNALYMNRDTGPSSRYNQTYIDTDVGVDYIDYNSLYHSGSSEYYYYKGNEYTVAEMVANTTHSDNDEDIDYGFNDPDGADNTPGTIDDDYTLDGTNYDDGIDLSQCFQVTVQGTTYTMCYDDCLDPITTDWSTTPPTVATVKQDGQGNAWERGAYCYGGAAQPPPVDVGAKGFLRGTLLRGTPK